MLNGDDNENGSSVNHDHNIDLFCSQMNDETKFYSLHYVRKTNKKKTMFDSGEALGEYKIDEEDVVVVQQGKIHQIRRKHIVMT